MVIFYLKNVFMIIPFCASFGFMMTTLTTLPYQMLSEFQVEELLANQNTDNVNNGLTCFFVFTPQKLSTLVYIIILITNKNTGLGTACAFLSSINFLGQAITSTYISFMTFYFGNRAILVIAAIFGTLAYVWTLFFVIFPQHNASTRSKENQI